MLTDADRASITPALIRRRNVECGMRMAHSAMSRRVKDKPVAGTPFLAALSVRAPPTPHLSAMHFAGKEFQVKLIDGHLSVNWTDMLIALLETDLFQPVPPGTQGTLHLPR
jgi:hypothetical protein